MYTKEEIKQFEDEYEMVMDDYYSWINAHTKDQFFIGTAKPLRGKQDFDKRMESNRIRARKYWKNKHLAKHIEKIMKRPLNLE